MVKTKNIKLMKTIRFLSVAMLFTALSLGFASCDNDKGNEPEDPQGEQTEQGGSTENNGGGEETPEPADPYNGHAYVDLGLPSGLKWATCNVGADSPEEYGDYFAWGETSPKTTYDWNTYKWATATWDATYKLWDLTMLTKYNTDSDYGTVDNKIVLDPEDDAATVNMGGSWRMPTKAEMQELIDECTWTWTSDYNGTGEAGQIVTSKTNGNHIFLPATGYHYYSDLEDAGGYYWANSLGAGYSVGACGLYFSVGNVNGSNNDRYYGQSVRGVCE